jgi:GT2 family glycosyltransferase
MSELHRIVVVTPAGRRQYLDLLKHYILADEGIDEWKLWDNCRDAEDRKYINDLARVHSKIQVICAPRVDGTNATINQFYQTCSDIETFYIKMDDDIVFVPDGFAKSFYKRACTEAGLYTWWSPVVVNNATCSWLLKYHSRLNIQAPLSASANCRYGWRSASFALALHKAFLRSVQSGNIKDFKVPDSTISLARFSINCVGMFGGLVRKMGSSFCPVGVDDEEWISAVLPTLTGLPGRIVGDLAVAHFSYFTQEDGLIGTNILNDYYRLAGLPPIAQLRAPKRSLRQRIRHYVREVTSQDKLEHHIEPSAIAAVDTFRAVKQPCEGSKGLGDQKIVCVIVTFNRLTLLQECVHAVRQQTSKADQIIVINNGSTDGTARWLSQQPDLNVVTQQNVGGAGGFNRGLEVASELNPGWIWLMDDDTIPDTDCLERLVAASLRVSGDQGPLLLCSDVYWVDGTPSRMNRGVARKDAPGDGLIPMRACSFVSVLIRGNAVAKYGLPIKDFFLWADDFEYTARLLRFEKGYKVLDSRALHKTPTNYTTLDDNGPRHYYSIRNNIWIALHSNALSWRERCGSLKWILVTSVSKYLLKQHFRRAAVNAAIRGCVDGLLVTPDFSDDRTQLRRDPRSASKRALIDEF